MIQQNYSIQREIKKYILQCICILLSLWNITSIFAQSDEHGYIDELMYPIWSNETKHPNISSILSAESYLLLESENNQVLLKKNHRQLRSIASLTKLMTALVVIESIKQGAFSLDTYYPITSTKTFASLPYDASRMGLVIGDNPSGKDLLYGLLVVSGNDVALYLANIVAGSTEVFVQSMNNKAKALGLYNTYYDEPTGLSKKNRSTAEDLARLSQHIISYADFDFLAYTSRSTFFWKQQRKSTNTLLGTYTYIDGLKTGYTSVAGFNLIVSAIQKNRRIVAIILGIQADSIAQGIYIRSKEAKTLIDFAYDRFSLIEFPAIKENIQVWGAKQNTVDIIADNSILSIPALWVQSVQKSIHYYSKKEHIFAPINKELALASVVYSLNSNGDRNINIIEKKLYPSSSIEKANIFKRIWHRLVVLFK